MDYIPELKDPDIYPDDNILQDVLGKGYEAYHELLELYNENSISYEWKYYRDGKVWLCKATKKQKTIVWMSAIKGFLRATIYFPEKYTDGIYQLDISDDLKEKIKSTKNTGKSKGCTFEIKDSKVLKEFNIIMQYKLSIK